MHGTFRSICYSLLIIALSTSPLQAKEIKKDKQNKKLAAASIRLPDRVEKTKQEDKNGLNKTQTLAKSKQSVATSLPAKFRQNDAAVLSDDEITRIKLIKRYEGVKDPRTDWSEGLRTLNWHYTESNGE